ncbi:LysR substrate-binding domain-containing protein [Pigmentiphaga sp.]|uniref:LysR substrate-binding domain-containing protein n=1 Tax=Pigmentiphaga sp. TaxID=1977564 RepID=UPI0012C398ED|nr:LysR substrate-binding domain-containing protein [Pigmentiphaga sp.]MPS29716.1 LysR family transcriptional regulator [Alcaligenaceae bacterium SAGV5]MPS54918.1 LysR family transcriptional regulator [Alcaligenaceae bacterium SAGV3]MPT59179.1 LysR family transcriptional regulator [Alcaligenaceae bacterium]
MDINRLRYFVAVAETGGFSQAAATLHLAQSTLSGHVLALEEELGQRLLVRNGRGVEPTESGLAMLAHARAILEMTERARTDMRDRQLSPRGRVTVGLPPHVAHTLSADLVEGFRALYPDAVISVAEALSIRLREWLIGGRLDLALIFDPPTSPQLQVETLLREPLVVVGTHPLPPRIRLADVAHLPLILPSGPNSLRELLEAEARPRNLTLRAVAEIDSVQTVLSIVARGVAYTVLPAGAVRSWNYPAQVHTSVIQAPAMRNRLVLAVPRARPASRMTRSVAALLRELVGKWEGGVPHR